MVLKLYGVPPSQPVRAIMQALEMHDTPYEFVLAMPGQKKEGGSKHPSFLEKNPFGTVPVLEDDGFFLWESQAILTYLAKKQGWKDVYPDDPKKQGLIDAYFNYHHTNTRQITIGLFAPIARPDLKLTEAQQESAQKVAITVLKQFEGIFLAKTSFILSDTPTIADISAYQEIGQCQEKYCDLMDFSAYPKVRAWLAAVEGLKGHKSSHDQAAKFFGMIKKAAAAKRAKL
jgi:glutathione S-transferase